MQNIRLEKIKIKIFEYLDNKGILGDVFKGFVFCEVLIRISVSFEIRIQVLIRINFIKHFGFEYDIENSWFFLVFCLRRTNFRTF